MNLRPGDAYKVLKAVVHTDDTLFRMPTMLAHVQLSTTRCFTTAIAQPAPQLREFYDGSGHLM